MGCAFRTKPHPAPVARQLDGQAAAGERRQMRVHVPLSSGRRKITCLRITGIGEAGHLREAAERPVTVSRRLSLPVDTCAVSWTSRGRLPRLVIVPKPPPLTAPLRRTPVVGCILAAPQTGRPMSRRWEKCSVYVPIPQTFSAPTRGSIAGQCGALAYAGLTCATAVAGSSGGIPLGTQILCAVRAGCNAARCGAVCPGRAVRRRGGEAGKSTLSSLDASRLPRNDAGHARAKDAGSTAAGTGSPQDSRNDTGRCRR